MKRAILFFDIDGTLVTAPPCTIPESTAQAITQARKILLIASGADKADAIYASCFGPVTPGIPASILQLHQDVTVIADKDALSKCPQQAWAQKAPSKEIHTGFLFR